MSKNVSWWVGFLCFYGGLTVVGFFSSWMVAIGLLLVIVGYKLEEHS